MLVDRREEALTRHLERSGRADCIGAPCEAACEVAVEAVEIVESVALEAALTIRAPSTAAPPFG